MQYTVSVDGIEAGIARLIDDETGERVFNMPIALLPDGVAEGDVLEFAITVNPKMKEEKQQSVMDLLKELTEGKHLK